MKTYQEFIDEAKKCWPGYKKKGTQKLFGKTYNRCVKEGKVEWDNPKRPLQSGLTPREKNRSVRKRLGIETPDTDKPSFFKGGPSERDYERYGKLQAAHDTEKDKKVPKEKLHKSKSVAKGRLGGEYSAGRIRRMAGVHKGASTGRNAEKGTGSYAMMSQVKGGKERREKDIKRYGDYADLKRLEEPKESFDYSIDEAKSDSNLSKEQKIAVRNKRREMDTSDRFMVHLDDRGEKKQRGEKEDNWWKTKFVKNKSGRLSKYRDWHVSNQNDRRAKIEVEESWSEKYKKSIDCNNPKGFSQRAHCQGKKKSEII